MTRLPKTALTMAEREWLRDQAAELPEDALIVHIGVLRGASVLCSRAGNAEAAIIGIDLNPDTFEGEQDAMMALIEADSAAIKLEQPVALLFVDGDHTEAGVMADIETWVDRVTGIIAFHDYGWDHSWVRGVKLAVDKWDWTGWEMIGAPDSIRAYRRKQVDE